MTSYPLRAKLETEHLILTCFNSRNVNPFISAGSLIDSRIGFDDGPEYGGPFTEDSERGDTFFLNTVDCALFRGLVNPLTCNIFRRKDRKIVSLVLKVFNYLAKK